MTLQNIATKLTARNGTGGLHKFINYVIRYINVEAVHSLGIGHHIIYIVYFSTTTSGASCDGKRITCILEQRRRGFHALGIG